eukprot:TRINITY_DN1330_c1_g2_i1.p1 TRINITY_DN1330_c1_g2~~TRINITY_DN1330_c1_g2_i1.p1  ORF type:complete len:402 (-),score=82.92 TRINITY_DN1330_c1_g2_i1:190-1395(-)
MWDQTLPTDPDFDRGLGLIAPNRLRTCFCNSFYFTFIFIFTFHSTFSFFFFLFSLSACVFVCLSSYYHLRKYIFSHMEMKKCDFNVLITRRIPGKGIEALQKRFGPECVHVCEQTGVLDRSTLLSLVKGCNAILSQLSDVINEEVFEAAGPSLKIVANYAVGFNNVDLEAAKRRGIVVTNTPDVLSAATADIAWALLLACARRVGEGERIVRGGKFVGMSPSFLLGADLERKTLAVIGAGRIGYRVAKRALGWDMKILYVSRTEKKDFFGGVRVSLEDALQQADFVSLNCPLTPETKHLINRHALSLMKPTAYLINTARGAVVDEAALVDALRDRRIAGAGLDVYEDEPRLHPGLLDLENVVLLPHIGSATIGTRSEMGEMCAEAISDLLLQGTQPKHVVQ